MHFHVSPVTSNRKLGPIATTTTSRDSCPDSCPLKGRGCYGDGGPVGIHWAAVSAGKRGTANLAEHAHEIREASARAGMIRLNQVGDLPPRVAEARAVLNAPDPRSIAWTYTHRKHLGYLKALRDEHTVVNASANSPREADRFLDAGLATVCLQPTGAKRSATPAGRTIVRCPAEYRDDVTCQTCGNGRPLCARKGRSFAVGFTPHGSGASRVREVITERD